MIRSPGFSPREVSGHGGPNRESTRVSLSSLSGRPGRRNRRRALGDQSSPRFARRTRETPLCRVAGPRTWTWWRGRGGGDHGDESNDDSTWNARNRPRRSRILRPGSPPWRGAKADRKKTPTIVSALREAVADDTAGDPHWLAVDPQNDPEAGSRAEPTGVPDQPHDGRPPVEDRCLLVADQSQAVGAHQRA